MKIQWSDYVIFQRKKRKKITHFSGMWMASRRLLPVHYFNSVKNGGLAINWIKNFDMTTPFFFNNRTETYGIAQQFTEFVVFIVFDSYYVGRGLWMTQKKRCLCGGKKIYNYVVYFNLFIVDKVQLRD